MADALFAAGALTIIALVKKTKLCVKSNDDAEECIEISDGNDRRLSVRMTCWMKHHEKGIDNHFEKLLSNDKYFLAFLL